jgi:hypothetical protein
LSLDEYKVKLIGKILKADSQKEVNMFIDAAMNEFEKSKWKEKVVAAFVEKMIMELELFSPMKRDAKEWSNINMARILFNRIKNHFIAQAI